MRSTQLDRGPGPGLGRYVAELTAQVGRLSNDITRGFTVDADRYSGLVKRVEALVATLERAGF